MLPHALAEQLIIHSNRSVSRTKHGLIAPRFASNDVKNSIAYRGVVLWNAIGRNLVPRVLSYPPYGAVGENPGNEVGRSNGSIACVASVSNRVITRRLERKQKKG